MRIARPLAILLFLLGCGGDATPTDEPTSGAEAPPERYDVPSGDVQAALAGAHRTDEERARDRWRHPAETLAFFEVEPGKDVVELWPGRGWYTKILAPLLRDQGSLTVGLTDPEAEGYRGTLAQAFFEMQQAHPELYGHVRTAVLSPPDHTELGAPESADVVLTFRNTHNWTQDGVQEAVYAAAFRVLRPGGILGVVQHRDAEGAEADAERGYLPQAFVIETAEAAGFELVEASEINANPADTHDHPNGVWSLPPALRGGEEGREGFLAIGESARMPLKSRKPLADAEGESGDADESAEDGGGADESADADAAS